MQISKLQTSLSAMSRFGAENVIPKPKVSLDFDHHFHSDVWRHDELPEAVKPEFRLYDAKQKWDPANDAIFDKMAVVVGLPLSPKQQELFKPYIRPGQTAMLVPEATIGKMLDTKA
ncbi:MAG: hypothetical protein KTR14_00420 [Vampirovibrio sp.]|nr:hypothetical protein [Vampirovibrio sp.]